MSAGVSEATEARLLCFADGESAQLGRELGRGGEGAVFDVVDQPTLVAKRYYEVPHAAKQRKLRLMAEHIDSPLREYAAWPEETLHDETGAVIGFTMQRIEGRLPIHMLYSPAQRRESFPQARFDFLVFVARNIAAAFATLHEHGHVLGDVNQGNVLVGADSRVILIDCDSFQIQVGEALHRCEVGVAHFTPPELQSIASFEDITRTPNHDGFGLALLIFHLLMGGRHPYSGVPLADHIGESLEADIRDFRYAYAKDAAQRLIAPPPKSVPIESLPPEIVDLFEQAFTERGVDARPAASQWVAALDALRAQLQVCAKNSLHVHAGVIGECVWCGLDRRHVTLFGGLSRPVAKAEPKLGLDLDAMEAEISQMKLAEPVEMPGFAMPPSMGGRNGRRFPIAPGIIGLALFVGAILGQGFLPTWLLTPMTLVGFAMFAVSNLSTGNGARAVGDDRYARERFEQAEQRLRQSVASINAANGSALVGRWRSAVRELRAHLLADAPSLTLTAQAQAEPGLRAFLGTHKLAQWKDAQRFTMQRILLDASGIETAADFDRASLDRLRMIEAAVRDSLLQWRSELVQSYRQRIAAAPTAASREMLQRRHRRQRTLEVEVQEAYAKLRQARPPQLAVSSERTREFMALKAEASKLHARWLGSSNRI